MHPVSIRLLPAACSTTATTANTTNLHQLYQQLRPHHDHDPHRHPGCHFPATQMLDRDLEEAEEQYAMAVRGHMMIVDNLLDLQYQRMKALEQEFAVDLKALEDEFDT